MSWRNGNVGLIHTSRISLMSTLPSLALLVTDFSRLSTTEPRRKKFAEKPEQTARETDLFCLINHNVERELLA